MQFSIYRPIWQRCFAAFLLLWTLADLSVPGLCQSDNDGSDDSQVAVQLESKAQVGQPSPSGAEFRLASNQRQQSPQSSQEDCFCCCAHIAPVPHFHIATLQRSAQALTFYHFNQITASALPFYHPPRS